MESGHVTANGQRLYYEIHGEGEPLVMIQGLGGDVITWGMQIPTLEKHFKVIAFDNRDVGRSSEVTESYRMADMADDAAALMDALSLEQAHMVGISMGGMIAQEFALNHPNKVRKLVLLATMARCPHFMIHGLNLMKWIKERDSTNEIVPIAGVLLTMSVEFFKNDAAVNEMIKKGHDKPPYPQSLTAWNRQVDALTHFHALDRLSAIQAPTLVLVGDQDMLMPVWGNREIAYAIPGARLQILEGGGHGFIWEITDKVNQAIVTYLKE